MQAHVLGKNPTSAHVARKINSMGNADLKQWADTWQRAGRELAQIRRTELANTTDEMAITAALDILNTPLPADLPRRMTSGLVEQQRLFRKLHRRS